MSLPTIPEQENIEYKTCSEGRLPEDYWESVTGFSNGEGGTTYLGVRPDGTFTGLSAEELDKLQRDVLSECMQAYNHVIYPQIAVYEGKAVSVYFSPMPAAFRPIHLKRKGPLNGAKVRIGSANVPVDAEIMRRFAIAARGGAELVEYPANYQGVFDRAQIAAYLEIIHQRRGAVYEGLSQEEILSKLRAIKDSANATLFGILAFGKDQETQDILGPTFNVAVTQYPGTTKVDPTDPNFHAIGDVEFNGAIAKQFQDALLAISSMIPVRSRIDESGHRQSISTIPRIAIREALANALVHRDYSVSSSKVQVDIYTDRVELINPGRSLIPIEELDGTHSETRNPLLMSYMKDLGLTEQRARGIRSIRTSIRSAGLIDPKFAHQGNAFIVTLYTSTVITEEDKEWLEQLGEHKLNERQAHALIAIRHNTEGIGNTEYRSINHMHEVGDDIRAKKDLLKMVNLGLLTPIGEKKGRKYILGPNSPA